MARVKCFTALNVFLLLSLLAASLATLPASAFQQLGGVVGEGDSSFDTQVTSHSHDSTSSWNLLRRLLEEKKKKKHDDDDDEDDKKKKDKKKDDDDDDKIIKKKNKDSKSKYEKKTTDKKKNKDGDKKKTEKKKKKTPVIKKKKSPPPPAKKPKKKAAPPPKKKAPKPPAPKPRAPAPKPRAPAPMPKSSPNPVTYRGGGNPIDNCWLGSNWRADRKKLAGCALGFGSGAIGGRDGDYYVVTDAGDDAVNPAYGTLRWGITRTKPLWITFAHDMVIHAESELIVNSYKTIDGRGAKVSLGNGSPCFTVQNVQHVIIENIELVDCVPSHSGRVMSSEVHTGYRGGSDGDAISIFNGQYIWVDHCTLAHSADGLIDAIHGSDAITISNCYFSDHDKVMLFGHSDAFTQDKNMKVTVAYNTFGPNLVQRMPRCRHGQFHVINNDYGYGWGIYAIGGSANPTILSEGNRYDAMGRSKQVTKRETGGGTGWSWHSKNDILLNGAFFVDSGGYDSGVLRSTASGVAQYYSPSLTAKSGRLSL